MVKFEFILTDADAENLFDCINRCITQANQNAMDAIVNNDPAWLAACHRDADYLTELKTKLTNTRVKEVS